MIEMMRAESLARGGVGRFACSEGGNDRGVLEARRLKARDLKHLVERLIGIAFESSERGFEFVAQTSNIGIRFFARCPDHVL